MSTHIEAVPNSSPAHDQLLTSIPAAERRLTLAGLSTVVLEGGDGPPVVLLHGPGEFALGWMRVIPELITTHRVIAPDLPGHGASEVPEAIDGARMETWLSELIDATCDSRPALVGKTLGGAIGARFASRNGERLSRLVLVDSFGLAPFEPQPDFARALEAYLAGPTTSSYDALMAQCAYDVEVLRGEIGAQWQPLADYAVELASSGERLAALFQLMGELAFPPLPPAELERIDVPTTLIWGRHDRATALAVGEAASERYGWPLVVIDDAADDPSFDQPAAFVRALRPALGIPHKKTTR